MYQNRKHGDDVTVDCGSYGYGMRMSVQMERVKSKFRFAYALNEFYGTMNVWARVMWMCADECSLSNAFIAIQTQPFDRSPQKHERVNYAMPFFTFDLCVCRRKKKAEFESMFRFRQALVLVCVNEHLDDLNQPQGKKRIEMNGFYTNLRSHSSRLVFLAHFSRH